jgi:hypothetical protein
VALQSRKKSPTRRVDRLIALGLSCVVLFFSLGALALHFLWGLRLSPLLGPLLTATVGAFVAWSAATFSQQADERARMANSIGLARRWDEEPFLDAREETRGKDSSDLVRGLAQPKLKKAMIHWANFYWEMAVAIKTDWADELYLRERFRSTLNTFYPALQTMLYKLDDSSALEALETISNLQLEWNVQISAPNREEMKKRLDLLFAKLGIRPSDTAMATSPSDDPQAPPRTPFPDSI